MKARTLVVLAVTVMITAAALFIGPDRRPPRRLSTVGSVIVDSALRVDTLTASVDLRLDGKTEDFVFFPRIHVMSDGSMVVPQLRDHRLRIYSRDGKRTGEFGGHGSGPGEFNTIEPRTGTIHDTIWVSDGSNRRITYFSAQGKYLSDETVRWAFAAPRDMARFPLLSRINPIAVHANGYLASATPWNLPKPGNWNLGPYDNPIVSVGWSGMIQRFIGLFPYMNERDVVRISGPGARGGPSTNLPFRMMPIFTVAEDGSRLGYLTVADSAYDAPRFHFTVLNTDGDTVFGRDFPFVGQPIPSRVADSVIEHRASTNARFADAIRSETRKRMPPFYAPVSMVVFGRDSTIWLGLRQTATNRPWMVLDAQGTPIGTVTLPIAARIATVDRRNAWVVETDSDDIPSLVRYAITGWKQ